MDKNKQWIDLIVELQGLKFIVRHSIFPLHLYSKYYFYS